MSAASIGRKRPLLHSRILFWIVAGLALFLALIAPALVPVTSGTIAERLHQEERAPQWPVCERWMFKLRTDDGRAGLVDVTREQWEGAQVGDRWPR